jgi:conjugal transfer mating pair stabilization protein TraN
MLSTAMRVYPAYVVAMVMIHVIWQCEPAEFERNGKRQLKNCPYWGVLLQNQRPGETGRENRQAYSYFNSPLARLLQEQVNINGQRKNSVDRPIAGLKGVEVDPLKEQATQLMKPETDAH